MAAGTAWQSEERRVHGLCDTPQLPAPPWTDDMGQEVRNPFEFGRIMAGRFVLWR